MAETARPYPEGYGMSRLVSWFEQTFHLKPDRQDSQHEKAEQTFQRVNEVARLRKEVLEDREFPITSLLRDSPKQRGLR